MSSSYAEIIDIEVATAEQSLTNIDFEKFVETNDAWIKERTGIHSRPISQEHENVYTLSLKAASALQKKHQIKFDAIIAATTTAPYIFPNLSNQLAAHFNVTGPSFDLSAACSGYLYALKVGQSLIQTSDCENILIIAADTLSKTVDWKDRNTCILFGDAATATLLQKVKSSKPILCTEIGTYPDPSLDLKLANSSLADQKYTIEMNGKKVFKLAVEQMSSYIKTVCEKSQIKTCDVKKIIPHQANKRIIDAISHRLQAPIDQVYSCLENYGNTSAASIALALKKLSQEQCIEKGDHLILCSFGAGFTAGATHWKVSSHQKLFSTHQHSLKSVQPQEVI